MGDERMDLVESSGMINSEYLINDGLTNDCKNNGETTWTYNQGVILGGLHYLYQITGNATLLTIAEKIADAVAADEHHRPLRSEYRPDEFRRGQAEEQHARIACNQVIVAVIGKPLKGDARTEQCHHHAHDDQG